MGARHLGWAAAGALLCFACGPTQKVDRVPESSDATASAGAESATATPELSEGERTRLMEQKADDLVQQYQDAQATATTAEDRVKAYQEFEKGRQELNQQAEGDAAAPAAGANDEYAPPPEP